MQIPSSFKNFALSAISASFLLTAILPANGSSTGLDGPAAFQRIKSLAGEWSGPKMMGMKMKENFRVIANGSVVLETCFAGTPMEMVSLYYLKGDNLVMTHYCAMGNQPRMILNKARSTPETLVFDFDGGDNLRNTPGHMHSAVMHLTGKNKLEVTGTSKQKGKPDATCSSTLVRQ